VIPAVAILDTGIATRLRSDTTVRCEINLSGHGPEDDATDEHGHGTLIAETILKWNAAAAIVAVKLLGKYGQLRAPEQLEVAFEWLVDNHERVGIGVVCASFGDVSHVSSDERFRGTPLQRHISALHGAGVPTVAPAGNARLRHRGWGDQGMAWPAILREVISVGAVERSPSGLRLTDNSQRLHSAVGGACSTTVFAEPDQPGGTSGATAVVAACLLRLRAAFPQATVPRLVEELLMHRCEARDESPFEWPALDTIWLGVVSSASASHPGA